MAPLVMDEGPYGCAICSAEIRSHKALKMHMRKIHPERSNPKKAVSKLSTMTEGAMVRGLSEPFVCDFCGFCCTTASHLVRHKKVHPPKFLGKSTTTDPKVRRPAVNSRNSSDLRNFAAAIRDRAGEFFTGRLPPLCYTDKLMRPVAVYVPILLTSAESELMFQLSQSQKNLAIAQSSRNLALRDHCSSNGAETSFPPSSDPVRSEVQECSLVSLEPNPVDLETLNEVLEFACNERELSGILFPLSIPIKFN